MRRLEALVLLCTAATSVLSADSARPRGVGPNFAKFYKSKDSFTCISVPSVVISVDRVNDNYCDCPDGSDEPGTSACTYLSTLSPEQPVPGSATGTSNVTVALPGYYCKNKGHQPAYIPFIYVNDGVCDYEVCCDGSDEWEGVGGVKCEDRCAAMGKEHRKKEAEREKVRHEARKNRAELVKQAERKKMEVKDDIGNLKTVVAALEIKAAEAKKKYEDVERRERGRVVKSPSGKASKVSVLASLAKARVDELREALEMTIQERNDARRKVKELEALLSTFKEEYNPNFNDEGVKRAVKAWEDYAASKGSDGTSADDETNIGDIVKPDSETEGINWKEWEEEDSDVEAIYRFEEYLPESLRNWIRDKLHDLRVMLIENGILADNTSPGSESAAVTSARSAYQAVNDELDSKQTEIGNLERDLETNYGPDDIFRALKGSCVSQDSGEYTYELCWMERTTQKSKKGGGNTGMGDFVRFETVEVDEEVGADGKGLGSGQRIALKFENGQHCWNGPNRATTVILACAGKDEIWKVVEMEKCIYRMDVGTPAACEPAKGAAEKNAKDEL